MVHTGVDLLGQVDLLGLVLCQFHEKGVPRLECLLQEEVDKHRE